MIPKGVFRPPESAFAAETRFGANFHYENSKLLFADPPIIKGLRVAPVPASVPV